MESFGLWACASSTTWVSRRDWSNVSSHYCCWSPASVNRRAGKTAEPEGEVRRIRMALREWECCTKRMGLLASMTQCCINRCQITANACSGQASRTSLGRHWDATSCHWLAAGRRYFTRSCRTYLMHENVRHACGHLMLLCSSRGSRLTGR